MSDFSYEFDALLAHLKSTLNLDTLEKEDKNICTIACNDYYISFINQSGNLIFVSNFAKLSDFDEKENIKDLLLDANVMYIGSYGGSFAINNDGIISFAFQYPLALLSNDSFIQMLDIFINTINVFIDKIKKIEEQPAMQTASSTEIRSENSLESQVKDSVTQEHWQRV